MFSRRRMSHLTTLTLVCLQKLFPCGWMLCISNDVRKKSYLELLTWIIWRRTSKASEIETDNCPTYFAGDIKIERVLSFRLDGFIRWKNRKFPLIGENPLPIRLSYMVWWLELKDHCILSLATSLTWSALESSWFQDIFGSRSQSNLKKRKWKHGHCKLKQCRPHNVNLTV